MIPFVELSPQAVVTLTLLIQADYFKTELYVTDQTVGMKIMLCNTGIKREKYVPFNTASV